jgi:hypothetical protein
MRLGDVADDDGELALSVLQAAEEALKDPATRARYDRQLVRFHRSKMALKRSATHREN